MGRITDNDRIKVMLKAMLPITLRTSVEMYMRSDEDNPDDPARPTWAKDLHHNYSLFVKLVQNLTTELDRKQTPAMTLSTFHIDELNPLTTTKSVSRHHYSKLQTRSTRPFHPENDGTQATGQ